MSSENRATPGAGGDAGAGLGVGQRRGPLVWLAALGAACAVAGPFLLSPFAVQVVGEGSVGVLRFGGRVLDKTKDPGFHFVLPYFYELAEVPVNVRTTEMKDVPCGTSGGVLVNFPTVEVVHRLHPASVVSTIKAFEDYEQAWLVPRVKHDVNKLCARMSLTETFTSSFDQLDEMIVANLKENVSMWVPGLMIIAARVAKPVIPPQLQADFVRVEEEISKLKVAHQHEQLVIRKAEMERSRQVMVAEKDREIGSMTTAREVEEKEAELHIQRIQDEMHVARSKDHSDAAGYSRLREAEGNERRLSPAFLELARQKALYQNLEAYYGDRMPEYIHDRPQRNQRQEQEQEQNERPHHLGGGGDSDDANIVVRGTAAFWRGMDSDDAARTAIKWSGAMLGQSLGTCILGSVVVLVLLRLGRAAAYGCLTVMYTDEPTCPCDASVFTFRLSKFNFPENSIADFEVELATCGEIGGAELLTSAGYYDKLNPENTPFVLDRHTIMANAPSCTAIICSPGDVLCFDPHMKGLRGQRIELSGADGGWYALVKDEHADLHINVRLTAPLPNELPGRQLVTGLSVMSEGHSLTIEVGDAHGIRTAGCIARVSPCLADGGLRIVVDGKEADELLGFASEVPVASGAISVSASNLPAEGRQLGGDQIWPLEREKNLQGRRALEATSGPSFEEWILGCDKMPASGWCALYVAENDLADLQSTHAIFRIDASAATVRLDAGISFQGGGEHVLDGRVLPDLELWQMGVGLGGLDVEDPLLSGILGETARPVYDESGRHVMEGFKAFRGTVEDYRGSGPLGTRFALLDERRTEPEGALWGALA
eukprot:g13145.t1